MSKHRKDDDVARIPEREELPPELAAMAIPADDEDEQPTIILNANEESLRSTYRDFKPGALIGIAVAWLGKTIRDHQVATAVTVTAVASAAITTGMHGALQQEDARLATPIPSMITVAPPSATATSKPQATHSPTRTSPTAPAPATERTRQPPGNSGAEPTRAKPSNDQTIIEMEPQQTQPATSRPRRTPAPTPTSAQSEKPTPQTTATGRPTLRPRVDRLLPSLPSKVPALPSKLPELPSNPPPGPPPSAGRDCVIRVDLDPIADVCVLS